MPKPRSHHVGLLLLTTFAVAVLPVPTMLLRAQGAGRSRELAMAASLSTGMLDLAGREQDFHDRTGRFATLEELTSRGVELPEIGAEDGQATLSGSPVTFFAERADANAYTLSATVDDAPWVRVTIAVDPERASYSTSVDRFANAAPDQVLLWAVGIAGVLLALIGHLTWERGWWIRVPFMALAVSVLFRFVLAVYLSDAFIPTGGAAPLVGDSIWWVL